MSPRPEAGVYVRYEDNGTLVCRQATPEEAVVIKQRDPNQRLVPISPVHLTQPGGLKIMLRGTPQLNNFPDAKAAFTRAAARWEAVIQTPITIVIDVDFGPTRFGEPFPKDVLGSTDTQDIGSSSAYPQIRSRLMAGASSAQEASLYNSLPTNTVPTDIGNTTGVFAPTAVFRALGLINPVADPDGERGQLGPPPSIGFNSNFKFDFDPSDGIDPDKTDFDATAVHEIGHALGFTSNVGERELTPSAPLAVSVWDLFRFRPGTTLATFPTAQRILSSGGDHEFFIGGPELPLSTGRPDGTGGDGNQASHWKDDDLIGRFIGIMDPTIPRGQRETITNNDLMAIDSFGYRLTSGGQPPGQTEELSTDDGTAETGVRQDGVIVVNRLTPSRYPATLQTIRIFFAQFQGLPSPVGAQIGLIVFADPSGSGRPPNNPQRLVNQMVTIPNIPANGAFVDFNIQNGPTINSGDVYVGFQAPTPAGGVVFAADSNGPQQMRGFFSTDNGATFRGPLVLVDQQGRQTPINIMIRAVVSSGQPSAPVITVQPTMLDFGNVNVGSTKDLTLTVGNTGNAPLNVTSIASSNPRFSLVSPAVPFTVAATGQQMVTVRFSPTAAGTQTGTLTINSNDPNTPTVTVQLSGVGATPAAPHIVVQPTMLDFGNVNVGSSKNLTLTVSNTGNAPLTVSSLTIDPATAPFSVVSPSPPFTVNAGGPPQTVTVRFAPTGAGMQTGTLRITSNDPTSGTVNVSLTGQGVTQPPPSRTLSVPNTNGQPGQMVTIPVTLSDGSGISALQFTLSFNPAVLSVPSPQAVTRGLLLPSNFSVSANTGTPGQVTVVISPPIVSPIPTFNSGSGAVVNIAFQVAASATLGATSPLTLSNLSASDPNGNAVSITPQNGTFMIGAPPRTLSVANAQGAAGSTVTIPVNLSEGSGVSALQFRLSFNQAILLPAATNPVVLGSLVPSTFLVSANTATAGQITVVISPPIVSPILSFNSGSGAVVQVTFQVASTATSGATSPLTLSNLSASDPNGNAAPLNPQNGTFTVTAALRGDVNQDGVVNVQDLIRLIQHLTGERPLTGAGLQAADINGDGQVNTQDLILLIQILTGQRQLPAPSAKLTSRARVVEVGEKVESAEGITMPIAVSDGQAIAAARFLLQP